MIIACFVLASLLAAGAGALAVRAVFRALRWMLRLVRILAGLSLLAVTVAYYYPHLLDAFRKKADAAD